MRVLILGGAGMLGRKLYAELVIGFKRVVRPLFDFCVRIASPLLLPLVRSIARTDALLDRCLRGDCLPLDLRWQLEREGLERIAPRLAKIMAQMARTGIGTEECLKQGCLPIPVNFHSPVPDLADLEERKVWDRRSELAGIDFRVEGQLELLADLGRKFGNECVWPDKRTDDPSMFYLDNPSFSFGCAASTHSILRYFRPARVVEIGSGNSSMVIATALGLNASQGMDAKYTIIDPVPRTDIEELLRGNAELRKERVEVVESELFDTLSQNDILFIDSGHVARIGGDVNRLFLDILPNLKAGVIVHIHDIGLPWEYPKIYATNPEFRQFWTEAYLLQAFLALNQEYEVLLAMNYLMREQTQQFLSAFPACDLCKHPSISSSFWIRRKVPRGY